MYSKLWLLMLRQQDWRCIKIDVCKLILSQWSMSANFVSVHGVDPGLTGVTLQDYSKWHSWHRRAAACHVG